MDWLRRFYRKKQRQVSLSESTSSKDDEFVDIVEGENAGGLGDLISPEPTIAETEVNKNETKTDRKDERVEVTGYDSSTNESIPAAETRNIVKQPPSRRPNITKNVQNYPNNRTVNSNTKNIIHQPK